MEMQNSTVFLEYYNRIDKYLEKAGNYNTYVSFAEKVQNSRNSVVKRHQNELISLGKLRNAIVHHTKIKNKAIAEPHPQTVERIKSLFRLITQPPTLNKFIARVFSARKNDFINNILFEMRKNSFSQFPVLDDNGYVCEIINTNTISRWLSIHLEEKGTLMIEHVRVADLIPEIEFRHNYQFISRKASIYEAYNLFIKQIETAKRNLDALFITENGKPQESLLGLITIEDIAAEIEKTPSVL